jgi:phosphatidate cytidylyltransferase
MNGAAPQLLTLLLGVGGLLVVASLVGYALSRRAGGPNEVIDNLNARIAAWWGMVALMGLAFLAGRTGVVLLFALCSFAALREFMTLTRTVRADHWAVAAAFFVVLPVQYWLVWTDWYGLYSIFIPVYAFLLLPILAALQGRDEGLPRPRGGNPVGADDRGVLREPRPRASLPPDSGVRGAGSAAHRVPRGRRADVGRAPVCLGQADRRRKIAPQLSPSKTWEGFLGGVACATALGAGLWWMTPFTPWQAAGLALIVALMGFAGGLVMSAIKRDRGVKDWGHLIAGHGGFIDRLDSVIFAAPVFFHVVRYFWSAV